MDDASLCTPQESHNMQGFCVFGHFLVTNITNGLLHIKMHTVLIQSYFGFIDNIIYKLSSLSREHSGPS